MRHLLSMEGKKEVSGYKGRTDCLPKVGRHALYVLNSVLVANLYSSQGKGL